jgi:hypothetical protein
VSEVFFIQCWLLLFSWGLGGVEGGQDREARCLGNCFASFEHGSGDDGIKLFGVKMVGCEEELSRTFRDIVTGEPLVEFGKVLPNLHGVAGANVTIGGAAKGREVPVKESGEAKVDKESPMVREKAVVEWLGSARLNDGCSIGGSHEDVVDSFGAASIGGWFSVRVEGGAQGSCQVLR